MTIALFFPLSSSPRIPFLISILSSSLTTYSYPPSTTLVTLLTHPLLPLLQVVYAFRKISKIDTEFDKLRVSSYANLSLSSVATLFRGNLW